MNNCVNLLCVHFSFKAVFPEHLVQRFTGTKRRGRFGFSVAAIGDMDKDGFNGKQMTCRFTNLLYLETKNFETTTTDNCVN